MVADAIVVICTVLVVGAIIWVVIAEHNAPDYYEGETKEKNDKKDSEDRK